MEEIKKYIENQDWKSILKWGMKLNKQERHSALLELNEYKKEGREMSAFLAYAQVVCIRNEEDLKREEYKMDSFTSTPLKNYLRWGDGEALIEFFNQYPPDYLNTYFQKLKKDKWFRPDFRMIWKLYEKKMDSF